MTAGNAINYRTARTILGRPAILRETPASYAKPGHRNQESEEYRVSHLFRLVFRKTDSFSR